MRDDREIEDLLREHWQPELPEGMRERVLRRAEAAAPEPRVPWVRRWQVALVGAGLAAVVATAGVDHCRQSRLNAMAGVVRPGPAVAGAPGPSPMRERDRMLAWLASPAAAAGGEEEPR